MSQDTSQDPNCIFCKIVAGQIPANKVYEDDELLAFHDINPWAPVHVLIIPKRHIPTLYDTTGDDAALLGRMTALAPRLMRELGVTNGFRIVVNTWGTMGAIGATTGVMPSMTLAPGGVGGAVVSDNITVHHTFNIKRLAYEIGRPPDLALTLAPDVEGAAAAVVPPTAPAPAASLDSDAIETIVRRVLAEIGRR